MTEIFKLPEKELDEFLRGYLVCALWSTNDEPTEAGGEPLDANYEISDLAPATLAGCRSDCQDFMVSNRTDLLEYVKRRQAGAGYTEWECAGHDFWLTRNGHGAGFWDRGLGALGDRLSEAAKVYRDAEMYVGDSGKLYILGLENFTETEQQG